MNKLSRILSIMLCFAPLCVNAAGPVASTSGSNLTAFNPSNVNNNQWATMTNGRYDGNTTARADFGNCNAVVLRCAQPKCANGGCSDYNVASAIVAGCVQSNNTCKQYGDDLIQFMSAQLVASSNAKISQQNAQVEIAKAQAEAQAAAAAAANNQSQQQIQQMQSQMYEMQQQMAKQQDESAKQLQAALARQAEQSQRALDDMKTAATNAAMQNESGVSAYQQEAIDRGISADVLERQKITGQIMTEIENADTSLKELKQVMNNAFEYAGCDARGNNCRGPKRVKKWRELAADFITPYDNAIDKIYDALEIAQVVGVDLSQIYMMLNDSCSRWGQYMCGVGDVVYPDSDSSNDIPKTCPSIKEVQECKNGCVKIETETIETDGRIITTSKIDEGCEKNCEGSCKPCRLLKILTNQEDVYAGWIDAEQTSANNQTVVSCASGVLNTSKLLARHAKRKNGNGVVDIDTLEKWLIQTEPNYKSLSNYAETAEKYCAVGDNTELEKIAANKNVAGQTGKNALCVSELGETNPDNTGECTYINKLYGLCDTHPYNANKDKINSSDDAEQVAAVLGLKATIISQQIYKQYEYLSATIRRLKTQLEKAVLTANLQAAGAKDDGSSSGGLVGASSRDEDNTIFLPGAENCWNTSTPEKAYACIQSNINIIRSNASTNKKKAAQQLKEAVSVAKQWGVCETKVVKNNATETYPLGACAECNAFDGKYNQNTDSITKCANALNIAVARTVDERAQKSRAFSSQTR